MTLRRKFIIFASVIHIILIILSLLLLSQSKYLFMVAEALIITSLIITAHLYRAFLKPLNLLATGIESIKDREFSSTFVMTGQVELDKLIDVYNRMIRQLRAERVKQREQHYFLERLIESSPIGIIILDLDERISMLNQAAKTILEVESDEVLGRSLEYFDTTPWDVFVSLSSGETQIVTVTGVRTYRCRRSHFLDRGFHRHFIVIEELTAEILRSQKRAYEKVIRMMSHEINNSVGAINSILNSSMHYRGQLRAEDREDFGQALQVAIDRNNSLNRFMSNFADIVRIPAPTMETYDLHELLMSIHVLMAAECERRNIRWEWNLESSPMMVEMDVQQMEQVVVNIIKNAVEAIDHDGTIAVATSGKTGVLRIVDSGKGITADQRAHLFTPFYSTKRDGQGIGLTMVREILVNHGFQFNLETKRPGHTEFWVDFQSDRSHRIES